MSRNGADNAIHEHAGSIRRVTLDVVAAALITFATLSAGGAMAQESANNPKPAAPAAPAAQGRMEAPIGHRQPRAEDLPHRVLQTEGSSTQGQTELDRKLNSICRGC